MRAEKNQPNTIRAPHVFIGLVAGLALLMLVACTSTGVDPAQLPDVEVLARATASNCGCVLYGSYPHNRPTRTPTPTGTWVPARPTSTPTPTRPWGGCDYCTMPPRATRTVPAWPSAVTCTAAPDESTSTPMPTEESPLFPTFAAATPLPAVLGVINPQPLEHLEGDALPGGVTIDLYGHPVLVWSQFNADAGQEAAGRVYVKTADPQTGQWRNARSVNPPGIYKIGKAGPESAIAAGPDGTIYVVYVRSDGTNALLEWRASSDGGTRWSSPADLPYPSSNNELYNVRLVVDPAGQPHIVALLVQTGCDPEQPCGDVVYYERRGDGSWREERRPVSATGARQNSVAVATLPLPNGAIRSILAWSENSSAAYSSYKDGPDGAWSRPVLLSNNHPPMPDYEPGFGGTMRLQAFGYAGRPWVWAGWSSYSTGYVASTWSSDGGMSWTPEDAIAYLPIESQPGEGTPFVPPRTWGTIHEPTPYWSAAHNRLLVISNFCTRGSSRTCFPVLAYGKAGAQGREWAGYISPNDEPVRLFGPTSWEQASQLRGPTIYGGAPANAILLWREPNGSRELHIARLNLDVLMSGTESPR